MINPGDLLVNLLRIVFLRGSPERIRYDRWLFIVSLVLALCASGLVQHLFFGDHLIFALLRVFAEVTMFMLMIVLLTAKVGRLRLANLMLVLVLINLLMDIVLLLCAPLPDSQITALLPYTLGLAAFYGGSSCVKWALRSSHLKGAGYLGVYLVAAIGLDLVFRNLYNIMAAG